MANTELKIKMLKDNKGIHFLPFSTSKAVFIDGTDKTVDTKLTEIEAAIPTNTSDLNNDSNFVSDANYVHTDNNYTTAEKTKLSGIETGAQVNIIETVKVNGSALTPDVNKAVDVTIPAAAEYTIAEVTATTGYAKSYQLKKDNAFVGAKIDIPKDLVVSSGEVKTVTTQDVPYIGAQVGDKYIDLTLNDPNQNHIYIPVNDLVDAYTAGNGIDISNTNVVSTKIDSSNANGLSTSANGLALAAATTSTAGAMSSIDKSKLDNVETNAEVNIIETIKVNGTALIPDQDRAVDITVAGSAQNITYDNTTSGLTADDVQEAIDELVDEKVDKVSGKGLSTEDYTTAEKTKLLGIDTGAQVNIVETIKVNNSALTPDANKAVNISVPTKTSDLTNDSGFIDNTVNDLTNYYTKTSTDTLLNAKQDIIQYSSMPTAAAAIEGKIVQYIGNTTSVAPIYTNGYFYKCVESSTTAGTYLWENIDIMDVSEFVMAEEMQGGVNYSGINLVPAPGTVTETMLDSSVQAKLNDSGVTDYDDLTDKPSINNVTLSGNKTSADLGISSVQVGSSWSGTPHEGDILITL